MPRIHSVPGPWHVAEPPSPVAHSADDGIAVAVTENPPTEAVADCGSHDDNHIQVGMPTS
jgi:hypothetical protein